MGAWTCGFLFWRFWLLGVERVVRFILCDQGHSASSTVYLWRAAAFFLIIVGIVAPDMRKSVKSQSGRHAIKSFLAHGGFVAIRQCSLASIGELLPSY